MKLTAEEHEENRKDFLREKQQYEEEER